VEGPWTFEPAYSDEFDGQSLDTEKWNRDYRDWGAWSWEPENAFLEDGALQIRMRHDPHTRNGDRIAYTSGIVRARAPPLRYGFFAARMKAADRHPGVAPAFWAWECGASDIDGASCRDTDGKWTEIDFVELTQKQANPQILHTNTHVFRHPTLSGGEIHEGHSWTAPWDPRDEFHVYSCHWAPDRIRWFVDGTLVRERANEYWDQPLAPALSMGVRGPLRESPTGEGFPTAFETDWIRVWQRPDEE
jgi:beta-glucanase (GH16 family)